MVTQYQVDPDQKFANTVAAAVKEVSDLRPAFQTITRSWFKSNRAIFSLVGPGAYVDLTKDYKKRKQRRLGFVYPILRASGLLEKSLTEAGDDDSVVRIEKTYLDIGTATPYALFLHKGTKKMKARPVIFLGAEQVSPDEIRMRRELWIKTIFDFVFEKTGKTLAGE